MQVEVCVQDYFSQPVRSVLQSTGCEDKTSTHTSIATLPIAPETWLAWFRRWLETLQPDVSPSQTYELSLRLTDNQEIQSLYAQYCQQNRPTDVLAFAALEVDCPQAVGLRFLSIYLGDIVISVETAYQQAREHQNSLEKELAWLAAHGLLHLLGWDHPDEVSLRQMLNQQDILLETVGFPPKI